MKSAATNRRQSSPSKTAGTPKSKKLSRTRRPPGMSLEDWQVELRRQFGAEQDFRLRNLDAHPLFSRFEVANPQSKTAYVVSIRGAERGANDCSCPDFQTNGLGTCKHIEFTLARLRGKRGAARLLDEGWQPPFSEVRLSYIGLRSVCFTPGAEISKELARLANKYFDDDGRLLPEAFRRFDDFLATAANLDDDLRVQDEAMAFVAQIRDAESRRAAVTAAFPQGIDSPAFDGLLRASLYEYQKKGALFAATAGRCLIADEMGLGKTIQAIAAAEIMARLFGVERVLIVCPTSLKHQWEREIERFTNRSSLVIQGYREDRRRGYGEDAFFKITNYDSIHADLEFIDRWGPDLVILDEAQRIKNWSTRVAKNVKKISSPYAIVLTGTPLENRLEELVSIVQFVDIFLLGPTYRFLHDHQILDEETARVVGYRDLDRISKTLAPVLLRRRKSEVLAQLPARMEKLFFVPMTAEQLAQHGEARDEVARIVAKWRRFGFLTEADQLKLQIALMRMRMSCDDAYLNDPEMEGGFKVEELTNVIGELLEEPSVKIVVFSQWLKMHELIERSLERRGWDHVLFHGGVPGKRRKELIDRFRDDPECRLFLATDAGGVGLNLQHASVVINVDMPWNPAVLEQRIGRVHRMGQTRPIQVIHFVAQGAIEEGMLSVLSFKKSLFEGALDGGEKEVLLGGSRLSKFLEAVESATSAIPASAPVEPAKSPDDFPDAGAASDETLPVDAATDPLATWIEAGVALVRQLSAGAPKADGPTENPMTNVVDALANVVSWGREPGGESYLKVRAPAPAALRQMSLALERLAGALRGLGERPDSP